MKASKQSHGASAIAVQDEIRVGHVANLDVELASADDDGESLRRRLDELGYDQTLVREKGKTVSRYALRKGLRAGTVGSQSKQIEVGQVTHASTPVLDVVHEVVGQRFLFVAGRHGVEGIITCADLQKVPVRIALFGLITSFELSVREVVAAHLKDEDTLKLLSENRRRKAMELHAMRAERRQELRLIDCCQLGDLGTLVAKLDLHGPVFGRTSKGALAVEFKSIKDLRDRLAHASGLDLVELPAALKALHDLLLRTVSGAAA